MIDVGNGKSVNPLFVVTCEIDNVRYMNGSDSFLIITLSDGSRIRRQHGYGIDIYAIKDAIEKAVVA
jgi:hypothetical protein